LVEFLKFINPANWMVESTGIGLLCFLRLDQKNAFFDDVKPC